MGIGGITFPELDTFGKTIRRGMATRRKKTSGICNVGQIAFRWTNNSEEWDFGFYARRVFEFRDFDTFGILILGWIEGKPRQYVWISTLFTIGYIRNCSGDANSTESAAETSVVARSLSLQRHLQCPDKLFSNAKRKLTQKRLRISSRT